MILSKTYTEEELYVDDIDQSEDNLKCNICEKAFPRLAIWWDILPMLIRKKKHKRKPLNTQGTKYTPPVWILSQNGHDKV